MSEEQYSWTPLVTVRRDDVPTDIERFVRHDSSGTIIMNFTDPAVHVGQPLEIAASCHDPVEELIQPQIDSRPAPCNDAHPAATIARPTPHRDSPAEQMSMIECEFDAGYYLATYPDIGTAKVNPLEHFYYTGWKEGRDPNGTFDTTYYLAANEDVRDAGLNPFWHYVVSGKGEGRLPRRPGGYRRDTIDRAKEPSSREASLSDYGDELLSLSMVEDYIKARTHERKGIVLALSHDCYLRVIGGTQIFISDEQRRFNAEGYAYIHISPRAVQLTLAAKAAQFLVRIVVDGILLALLAIDELTQLLSARRRSKAFDAIFVIHCIFGFHVPDVCGLSAAFEGRRNIFWLHDYSSLCEGHNLLRNDVQFCGAPPASSVACRICVNGTKRAAHLSSIRQLFETCAFEVACPSDFALRLWVQSTNLQRTSEYVHPHWALRDRGPPNAIDHAAADKRPISIAFVGYPTASKGWPLFREIVRRFAKGHQYSFYHFASQGTASAPDVNVIKTEVTPGDRTATQQLLMQHKIDFVFILSPWPETFSFVAHEAIAAGVRIVCLADSGNVAALVRTLGCGMVFKIGEEIIRYLEADKIRDCLRSGADLARFDIDETGTSATIPGVLKTEEARR